LRGRLSYILLAAEETNKRATKRPWQRPIRNGGKGGERRRGGEFQVSRAFPSPGGEVQKKKLERITIQACPEKLKLLHEARKGFLSSNLPKAGEYSRKTGKEGGEERLSDSLFLRNCIVLLSLKGEVRRYGMVLLIKSGRTAGMEAAREGVV